VRANYIYILLIFCKINSKNKSISHTTNYLFLLLNYHICLTIDSHTKQNISKASNLSLYSYVNPLNLNILNIYFNGACLTGTFL